MVVVVIAAWRFPVLDVVTVVLFVPLVAALSHERSVASRVLGWGWVHWLGLVSYSVYLLHVPLACSSGNRSNSSCSASTCPKRTP